MTPLVGSEGRSYAPVLTTGLLLHASD